MNELYLFEPNLLVHINPFGRSAGGKDGDRLAGAGPTLADFKHNLAMTDHRAFFSATG